MNNPKITGYRHLFQFYIDENTKDQLDDLRIHFGDEELVMIRAIQALHRMIYPPKDQTTQVSATNQQANEKLDDLLKYVEKLLAQPQHIVPIPVSTTTSATDEKQIQLTQEANEKILAKIDELNVKFSKQTAAQEPQTNGIKHVTTEMSNEEILQLLKRMDQMESKITRVISEKTFAATRSSGPTRSGPMRDLGDGNAPKIHAVEGGGQPMDNVERPLLDDVLDTVIVSVEDEE